MDYAILANELTTDPAAKGYAALLPDNPGQVCELLNSRTESMVKPRFVTGRTILAECGEHGGAILDALEAVATANSSVKWAVIFLKQDGGIDVGHDATQEMIAQLVNGGALTAAQGNALSALAVQPASRAETLGLPPVSILDVYAALEA